MGRDILKILRIFVLHNHLDRDPSKWVLELGAEESEVLIDEYYRICGVNDEENNHRNYKDSYDFGDFVLNGVYRRTKTFRGITIEWFKPELAFREKEDNGQK